MAMPGIFDARGMWERQIRTVLHQQLCRCRDVFLLRVSQLISPFGEFIGIFDVPSPSTRYSIEGIMSTTIPWKECRQQYK
jgi:hypothetical protein